MIWHDRNNGKISRPGLVSDHDMVQNYRHPLDLLAQIFPDKRIKKNKLHQSPVATQTLFKTCSWQVSETCAAIKINRSRWFNSTTYHSLYHPPSLKAVLLPLVYQTFSEISPIQVQLSDDAHFSFLCMCCICSMPIFSEYMQHVQHVEWIGFKVSLFGSWIEGRSIGACIITACALSHSGHAAPVILLNFPAFFQIDRGTPMKFRSRRHQNCCPALYLQDCGPWISHLQHLQDVGASTFTLYGIICSIFKLKSFIARDLQQQGFAAQVWPEFTVVFLEMSEKSGLCHCVCSRLLFLFGLVVAMFQRIRSFNHVVNFLQLSFPYFEVMCG